MARSQKTADHEYLKWNRLLRKLGVTPEQILALPQITPYITRQLKLPRERVIGLLRMSSDAEVTRFLEAYDSHLVPEEQRANFNYEFYCAASGLSPLRLLELLAAQIVRQGAQHSALTAALRHPEVVQATIDSALVLGPDGKGDRDTIHKAVGFLPQPKGAQTTIQIQANAHAGAIAAAVSAPPPELTIKSLTDRFNDAEGLRGTAAPALTEKNDCEEIPEEILEHGRPELVPELVPVMAPAQRLAQRMYEEAEAEE